jgi:hypothetical protein
VEKYGTAKQATDDNKIKHMEFACRVTKTRIHAHTHSAYLILMAFSQQQWLHEHASVLCYMYTACLVKVAVTHRVYFVN